MNKDNFLGFIIAAIKRLIASAIAEKISVIATDDYLQQQVQRVDNQDSSLARSRYDYAFSGKYCWRRTWVYLMMMFRTKFNAVAALLI